MIPGRMRSAPPSRASMFFRISSRTGSTRYPAALSSPSVRDDPASDTSESPRSREVRAIICGGKSRAQSASLLGGDQAAVDIVGELLDPLAQLLREARELRVLAEQLEDLRRLLLRQFLSLEARLRERLAVLRVGIDECLVSIGLPRLGEQDERRRVGGLQAEGEVQEDEGIDVEAREPRGVGGDPDRHHDRLPDEEGRRPEEAGEAL